MSWFNSVKIIYVNLLLCQLYMYYFSITMILQENNQYVPKKNRWNRLDKVWTMMMTYIQYAFDFTYDWVTKMKVPRRRRRIHRSFKKVNGNLIYMRRQRSLVVNESRAKKIKNVSSRTVLFDSDAKQIGIDNRCSACISHYINDFVGPVVKSNKVIKSFGGQKHMNVYKGTIVWSWTSDDGVRTKFKIPNSYYVPEGRRRLLSPQHWASSQPPSTFNNWRWYSSTHSDRCVLHYCGKKLTVPIGMHDNVATFYTSSGFKTVGGKETQ